MKESFHIIFNLGSIVRKWKRRFNPIGQYGIEVSPTKSFINKETSTIVPSMSNRPSYCLVYSLHRISSIPIFSRLQTFAIQVLFIEMMHLNHDLWIFHALIWDTNNNYTSSLIICEVYSFTYLASAYSKKNSTWLVRV